MPRRSPPSATWAERRASSPRSSRHTRSRAPASWTRSSSSSASPGAATRISPRWSGLITHHSPPSTTSTGARWTRFETADACAEPHVHLDTCGSSSRGRPSARHRRGPRQIYDRASPTRADSSWRRLAGSARADRDGRRRRPGGARSRAVIIDVTTSRGGPMPALTLPSAWEGRSATRSTGQSRAFPSSCA